MAEENQSAVLSQVRKDEALVILFVYMYQVFSIPTGVVAHGDGRERQDMYQLKQRMRG